MELYTPKGDLCLCDESQVIQLLEAGYTKEKPKPKSKAKPASKKAEIKSKDQADNESE